MTTILLVLLLAAYSKAAPVESTPPVARDYPSPSLTPEPQTPQNLNSNSFQQRRRTWSSDQMPSFEDFGLVEVTANDLPEETEVYVYEEPANARTEGETLETADNIVFRPLFRYRNKQQALRRNSYGYNRRYFVPKGYYRRTYYPNYYYTQNYHPY